MRKIFTYAVLALMLASCGADKTDQLKGLWVLNSDQKLQAGMFDSTWIGEIEAAEIYETDGIFYFDIDYRDADNPAVLLDVSEDNVSMNFFGKTNLQLSESGDMLAFANRVYRKIDKKELETAIEQEELEKKKMQAEIDERKRQREAELAEKRKQQQIEREQREKEAAEKREQALAAQEQQRKEREINRQKCDHIKKVYEEKVAEIKQQYDYDAYKPYKPEYKELREKYKAAKKQLKTARDSAKSKIERCY